MEIRKRSILVFLVVFSFFAGNYAGFIPVLGIALKIINNVTSIYIGMEILQRIRDKDFLYSISPITRCSILYLILLEIISAFWGREVYLFSTMKICLALLWLDSEIYADKSIMMDAVKNSFWVWCIIDSIFTFLNPEGVFFLVGNEYILGGKNNKIFFFLFAMLLGIYKYFNLSYINEKVNFLIKWLLFSLLCIANAQIIGSSTTLVVVFLMLIYPFVRKIVENTVLTKILPVICFHICLFIIIIFVREMFQSELDYIMNLLFEKDATFTGRIYIWRDALLKISQSPIIGYGRYAAQASKLPSGYEYMWTMSHNQILEIMMQGGIILLTVWITMIVFMIRKINRLNSKFSKLAVFAIFTVFFFFQTEASTSNHSFFLMMLIYRIAETHDVEYADVGACE